MSKEAIAERLKPVGELCLQGDDCGSGSPAAAAASGGGDSGGKSGEEIYNSVCMACHETGAAGAPVRSDEAAWSERTSKGFDTLLAHSINGFNAMPARGGNPNLSDEEMHAATAYLLEPVMDVPAQGSGEQAASDGGEASGEGQEAASADAGQQEQQAMAQNDAGGDQEGANADQGGAAETAAAGNDGASDLPGADKIGSCVACHGQDGMGTAPMYPNLAGQNAAYMESALKAYRAGERQGGMSAVMTPMASSLSDEDITDIAEYYSQQTP
ncbi:Cytochrome c [Modicisalibacter ilicicola DSM 19980]|uniref:Cytochrome c n=1 Tax=Modicisalibacter ilicicola DSM 19980 TaxID=1121942 RepID=A0A1M4W636_9GAMM|nr:c-type cytochrome [Halomonas ilicicola]SHE76744.1 Cytochrome c [Halomonas ilicicola DSM 19980]